MILISIKSEVMDSKRQFEKDLDAEKFLRRVKRIHDLARWQSLGYFPKYIHPKPKGIRFARLKKHFIESLKTAIPLRVEIINTKANQLQMQLKCFSN